MKKAYIFDLDGTLADSLYDIGDSVNRILARRGFPLHTYDEYRTYMGMGIGATLSRAMPDYDTLPPEEQAELRREYTLDNEAHCLDKTRPYEGVIDTLKELQNRGTALGIFTNKPEVLGKKIAAVIFEEIRFAFILGGVEGASMKPDPSRVLAELERLGIVPGDAVFIGDGKSDIETGKNGGMKTCGVDWGFKGREEIEGADIIISHPRELLTIVQGELS